MQNAIRNIDTDPKDAKWIDTSTIQGSQYTAINRVKEM
jgi:hypothetical protein